MTVQSTMLAVMGNNHAPIIRMQPTEWTDDGRMRYLYAAVWEVVCLDCGDTGGPFDSETPEVQRIRGPYTNVDAAKAAATAHRPA